MERQSLYPIMDSYKHALLDERKYQDLYKQSIENPDKFWADQAGEHIDWFMGWDTTSDVDFSTGHIKWFTGGQLNVCYNCVDRHLPTKGNQTAIIWEGDDPTQDIHVSYIQLHRTVCKFANVLKQRGIKKGDKVCIYMPTTLELSYAILACARLGAVHVTIAPDIPVEGLQAYIQDSDSVAVITAESSVIAGVRLSIKPKVDAALLSCANVHTVIVVSNTEDKTDWIEGRDVAYELAMAEASLSFEPEWVDAEDPLFILYLPDSSTPSKGLLHTSGGYLLYAAMTHKYVFDYQSDEVYWCTARATSITGLSYVFYGPLANGATTLMHEGDLCYPLASRTWQIIDKHHVNIFYAESRQIDTFKSLDDGLIAPTTRDSLRILGIYGEPIKPDVWQWCFSHIGNSNCPIMNTYSRAEGGGILISPLPGATQLKPGSALQPFLGINPVILDGSNELAGEGGSGSLAVSQSWPGQIRGVYNDSTYLVTRYYSQYSDAIYMGEQAKRDSDGDYWIIG